ncbi:hypothetical protein GGU45_003144 [Niabella hirudinis]
MQSRNFNLSTLKNTFTFAVRKKTSAQGFANLFNFSKL